MLRAAVLLVGCCAARGECGALEHELHAGPLVSVEVGGALQSSSDGRWLGAGLAYGLRVLGPVWVRAGFELSEGQGRSATSASRLEFRRQALVASVGLSVPLGRRLELSAGAGLSNERLREQLFPRGGLGGPVSTRLSGAGWRVGVGASFAVLSRLRLPLELRFERLALERPLEELTSSQLTLRTGLAWRLGRARR